MIKSAVRKFLVFTMSYKILQWCRRGRVIILMYHGFYDENQAEGLEEYGSRWCGINKFKMQIDYLRRHYKIISLDRLHQYCIDGINLPGNSVIITMDDGYESNYSLAYPYLKQHNVPFSIFVSTSFIDSGDLLWGDQVDHALWQYNEKSLTVNLANDRVLTYSTVDDDARVKAAIALKHELQSLDSEVRKNVIVQIHQAESTEGLPKGVSTRLQTPLSWEQIQEFARDPLVSIGSHTVSHPNLTTCTDEQIKFELSESRSRIEKKIGVDRFCPVFCYPGGAHDKRVHNLVEQAGYSSAVVTGGKSIPNNFSSRYDIGRLGISRDLKLDEMIFRLCTC